MSLEMTVTGGGGDKASRGQTFMNLLKVADCDGSRDIDVENIAESPGPPATQTPPPLPPLKTAPTRPPSSLEGPSRQRCAVGSSKSRRSFASCVMNMVVVRVPGALLIKFGVSMLPITRRPTVNNGCGILWGSAICFVFRF